MFIATAHPTRRGSLTPESPSMNLPEYHARQAANAAANQLSRSSADAAQVQISVREILAHVEKALTLLDDSTNAEARAELQQAVEKLRKIGK